jgi:transcription antitermination factor NusG
MCSSTLNLERTQSAPDLMLSECVQRRWYALYTCSNHEKRVAEQLGLRRVEHVLPLYETCRRWKDRRVNLQLPLFPGYVFVRLTPSERLRVLQITGVVRLVGTGATPTPVADCEIENLQRALGAGAQLLPHPYLKVGRRVRIVSGSLAGYEGILVRRKGSLRVVLSIDLLLRSMVVDTDVSCIEPLPGAGTPGSAGMNILS